MNHCLHILFNLIKKSNASRIYPIMYSWGNSKPLRRLIGTTNTEPDHPQKQFAKPINTNEIKYNFSSVQKRNFEFVMGGSNKMFANYKTISKCFYFFCGCHKTLIRQQLPYTVGLPVPVYICLWVTACHKM